MTDTMRVILELGKTRRVVAGAMDWPIQFLIRRTAHHVMDHLWEMEDRS